MLLAILIILILNLLATLAVGFFAIAAAAYCQKLVQILGSSLMIAVPSPLGMHAEVETDTSKAN